jgi:hypothetical protein
MQCNVLRVLAWWRHDSSLTRSDRYEHKIYGTALRRPGQRRRFDDWLWARRSGDRIQVRWDFLDPKPTQPPVQCELGISRRGMIRRPERRADHPPPSSAGLWMGWSYTEACGDLYLYYRIWNSDTNSRNRTLHYFSCLYSVTLLPIQFFHNLSFTAATTRRTVFVINSDTHLLKVYTV